MWWLIGYGIGFFVTAIFVFVYQYFNGDWSDDDEFMIFIMCVICGLVWPLTAPLGLMFLAFKWIVYCLESSRYTR